MTRRKRVRIYEIERLERALLRFSNHAHDVDPEFYTKFAEWSNNQTETIRNADTALAHISAWLLFRRLNKCDPNDVAR